MRGGEEGGVSIRSEVQRTLGEKALFRENGYVVNDGNDDFNEVVVYEKKLV